MCHSTIGTFIILPAICIQALIKNKIFLLSVKTNNFEKELFRMERMNSKILIVEDDNAFGILLKKWFSKNGFEALVRSTLDETRKDLLKTDFKLIMTDLRLPDGDGIMLLTWIKEKGISTPVIIMTSYGEVQSAVAAIKLGALDYMEKPINPDILKSKMNEALNHIPVQAPKENIPSVNIVYGKNTLSKKMYEHIQLVAPTHLSVLIRGESGTGKEYTARMIHDSSDSHHAPFIAVDCGSLSRELAPSELFGHLKGAFTSAIADKKGVFEQAEGGTVFLDEVGNLSYEVYGCCIAGSRNRSPSDSVVLLHSAG
jgi:two-component system response regulator HydG